jgi:hypothetical protein
MVLRRLRGVLTTATLWGLAWSLTVVVFTSAFFLAGANRGSGHQLVLELADLLPMAFGLGGMAGALFALFVLLAERRQTLRSVAEHRFHSWGIVAGALPIAIVESVARVGQPHTSLMSAFYAILCGGFVGGSLGAGMLRAARRGDVNSRSDQSGPRSPVI